MAMSDVVMVSEGMRASIGFPHTNDANMAMYLVARLFTDAVFNGDIRAIQLIIGRIDGGLPKDTEMDQYQTEFSDCLNAIMAMPANQKLKVMPDDTVLMSLAKALYAISVQDIYWDENKGKPRKPTRDDKSERDVALRMVLERTGGRKTMPIVTKEPEEIETADWIAKLESSA